MKRSLSIWFLVSLVIATFTGAAFADDDGTGNEPCETMPESIEVCPLTTPNLVLPDLMTVIPKHLGIQNKQQREILRFSNGIANLGRGPWWLEPEFPHADDALRCQAAFQLFATAEQFQDRMLLAGDEAPAPDGTFAARCQTGNFDFHETHNHWHIDNVGEFKVCSVEKFDFDSLKCDSSTGDPLGIKFTFCLVDWYKLGENSPASDPTRNFFSCSTGFQGISPGWVDQYHQSISGQSIDITGLAEGTYVLVSSANVGVLTTGESIFKEENLDNNSAYVVFYLQRPHQGNPKLFLVSDACDDGAYWNRLKADVEEFIEEYHPGDTAFRDAIIDDMCGGKSANR